VISPYRRKRAIAAGLDAAAALRKNIRRAGWAKCTKCGLEFLPSAVDIDHIIPLAQGGQDIPSNVQCLCRPCHKAKTRDDFGFTNPPF
jgi:5-methylcytosine-specific restriction protein A